MGIVVWIIVILIIAALIKYLLSDSGKKVDIMQRPVAVLRRLLLWAVLAAIPHLVWEIAQLPLYTLWDDPDRVRVAVYVLHCVLGDVLIAVSVYLLTAIVFRDLAWPLRRPWTAALSCSPPGWDSPFSASGTTSM